MAIGVVADLGAIDATTFCGAPSSQVISVALTMAVIEPASSETRIAGPEWRTRSNWR